MIGWEEVKGELIEEISEENVARKRCLGEGGRRDEWGFFI